MNKILLEIFSCENKLGLTFLNVSFYCLEVSLAGELGPLEGWPVFLCITEQILRLTKNLSMKGKPQPGHDGAVGQVGRAEQLGPAVLAASGCFPGPTQILS